MTVTLKKEQALQMLKKVGAEIENGAKHLKARLVIEGRHIFLIPISNGSKEIPIGTAQKIFREAKLVRRDHCEKLRNCPMDKEEYRNILREQGIIDANK